MSGFWSDRPALVTGANGLLGQWLAAGLHRAGARVFCLVRQPAPGCSWWGHATPVYGDIRDQALLERVIGEEGVDTVFHIAAQALVGRANTDPTETFDINIRATWDLLETCRKSDSVRQVVYASTDKAYGAHPDLPYVEETPLRGSYPYEVSKSCADLIAQSYATTYGTRIAITRCANFYGGGDLNWNRIVPGTIRAALQGERPVIRSDGKFVRDYMYIEDAVTAYMMLAEGLATRDELVGEAFNFGHNVPVTVLELVERIMRLCGADLRPEVRGEASREIREQYLDASKARRLLGWEPHYSLTEGLLRTIGWYRAHLEREAKPLECAVAARP